MSEAIKQHGRKERKGNRSRSRSRSREQEATDSATISVSTSCPSILPMSTSSSSCVNINSTGLNSNSLAFQQLLFHQYYMTIGQPHDGISDGDATDASVGERVMALPHILHAWSNILKERASKIARIATALEKNMNDVATTTELLSIQESGTAIPDGPPIPQADIDAGAAALQAQWAALERG